MELQKTAHQGKLSGVFAPITTPFDDQGDVLPDKMAFNIQKLNESRLRGYLVLGTNGEFRSLSTPEQMEVLKAVVKASSPNKVIMAGTGRNQQRFPLNFANRLRIRESIMEA